MQASPTDVRDPDTIPINSPARVLFASLIGTTVEFFDFYIYATAAVLVFPALFFPASDPTASALASLATFGIAFFARPIGSALFGHFGDRVGRKTTLVLALSTMGLSTVAIGLLPTYRSIGFVAPLLLALCRFGQGLGLGGEWGGAVLLAVENAPPRRRAWYGMFPQLGAPLGYILSGGTFLVLTRLLGEKQFLSFGWRLPFLVSAVLVWLGLYVRLAIKETPVFRQALDEGRRQRVPVLSVVRGYTGAVVSGVLVCLSAFVIFYLLTVFALSWATRVLGYSRGGFLMIQLGTVVMFALGIPISAWLAERGRRRAMMVTSVAIALYGFSFAPLFTGGAHGVILLMTVGFFLMGLTYGPLGTITSELFPTPVRYTGSSLAFSFAGIVGASLAPYIATWLAKTYGLRYVGYYLSAAALITLVGLLSIRETSREDLRSS